MNHVLNNFLLFFRCNLEDWYLLLNINLFLPFVKSFFFLFCLSSSKQEYYVRSVWTTNYWVVSSWVFGGTIAMPVYIAAFICNQLPLQLPKNKSLTIILDQISNNIFLSVHCSDVKRCVTLEFSLEHLEPHNLHNLTVKEGKAKVQTVKK